MLRFIKFRWKTRCNWGIWRNDGNGSFSGHVRIYSLYNEDPYTLELTVKNPSSITQYSTDPAVYVKNVQITNNVPTVTGGTADKSFSVQPSLPDGLVLDEDTGVISGTPVVISGAQDYSIQVYGDDWNQLGEDIDGETERDGLEYPFH